MISVVLPDPRKPEKSRTSGWITPLPLPTVGAPGPILDQRHVVTVLADVLAMVYVDVTHQLPHVAGLLRKPGNPVYNIPRQAEAVDIVPHGHVERCGGAPFFLVAADVDVPMIGPSICLLYTSDA